MGKRSKAIANRVRQNMPTVVDIELSVRDRFA